jgi:hypothetical protein
LVASRVASSVLIAVCQVALVDSAALAVSMRVCRVATMSCAVINVAPITMLGIAAACLLKPSISVCSDVVRSIRFFFGVLIPMAGTCPCVLALSVNEPPPRCIMPRVDVSPPKPVEEVDLAKNR